jgi:hypothetical protein
MPQELALSRPQLAQLLGARLTHDLAGPLGTIMAAGGSAEGAALLEETVAELRLRFRLYAVVFGEAEALCWAVEVPAPVPFSLACSTQPAARQTVAKAMAKKLVRVIPNGIPSSFWRRVRQGVRLLAELLC